MTRVAIVFVFTLSVSMSAVGSGIFRSGTGLLDNLTSDNVGREMIGMGYVLAIHDSTSGVTVCSPSGVTAGQAAAVVKKYLQDNPASLHRDGDVLAHAALMQAWPCPKREPATPAAPRPSPPAKPAQSTKPINPF